MIDFPDLSFEVPEEVEEKKEFPPVYTGDLETDPFAIGRYPKPFVAGAYDGKKYVSFWGDDCVDRLFAFFATLPPGIIYFHNGGRFDFYYCMKYLRDHPALIINSRIVKTHCKSNSTKHHEVRDSYAIMPFALEKYKKTKVDYRIFEAEERNKPKNRRIITDYLGDDCKDLWDLCNAFVQRFGPRMTVGQTAMNELKKFHTFENLGKNQDKELRSLYYYGGRVQYFKKGILKGNWKVYDVNSMYPYVMRDMLHPVEAPEADTRTIRKNTCFVSVEGKNYGAFPTRTKQGLRFDIEYGTYHVSIHEFNAALDCGLFEPTKILRCVNVRRRITFEEFVTYFFDARLKAKDENDAIHALFYKYVLNSAYGKFAQDSSKFLEYVITNGSVDLTSKGWKPIRIDELDKNCEDTYIVWGRKTDDKLARMYNVMTGASITGGARSVLLRGLHKAINPIYCDTDSIICEGLDGVSHGSELGGWKLEAEANEACIAGKKLYALFQNGVPVKKACKGVKISPEEIRRVANGEKIVYMRAAPSYHLDGSHSFIKRTVQMR